MGQRLRAHDDELGDGSADADVEEDVGHLGRGGGEDDGVGFEALDAVPRDYVSDVAISSRTPASRRACSACLAVAETSE